MDQCAIVFGGREALLFDIHVVFVICKFVLPQGVSLALLILYIVFCSCNSRRVGMVLVVCNFANG